EGKTILITAFFAAGMLVASTLVSRLGDRHGHLLVMRVLGTIGGAMVASFVLLDSFSAMCLAVFVAGATLASISPVSLALQGVGLAFALACSKKPDDPLVAKAEVARVQAKVPALTYAWFTREAQDAGFAGDPKPSTWLAASIAKTIIGTCAMQLAGEKKLSLDADVSQYVGFPV